MIVKDLQRQAYLPVYQAMQQFTASRTAQTADEIWLVEHDPVFTQGRNGKSEHLLINSDIPLVQTDRGGQITYHGPGQIVAYCLFDLQRMGLKVRQMVSLIEAALISLLADYNIEAYARAQAPGVYVHQHKVAALGLRVKQGACYHGLSLNVAMDLTAFSHINPCGYAGLTVTDLKSLGIDVTLAQLKTQLVAAIATQLKKVTDDRNTN